MKKMIVLDYINQNPKKYCNGFNRTIPEIEGQRCIISRDMTGSLIVSYNSEVYTFSFDENTQKWR
jgi:hypothetical protein